MKRTPLVRRTPVRRSNPKRRATEFARCYGSAERVQWIKLRRCIWCGATPCANSHIRNGGAGRKGPYWEVLPMCFDCDRRYEANDASLVTLDGEPLDRDALLVAARVIEVAYQRSGGEW